ncbi:ABC transporter, ATP-binding component [Chlamydia abortus]|jgi:ABC-2 type transport system ATP-binding protein|uniref:ABC transporter ATP-binding protein n=1 Tax=Paenibacillus residui TaxID=629724 RepID=A0ABW3D3K7_9BACL|nr:ABC transporter, ATP-binding component [Chlamydia abortus]
MSNETVVQLKNVSKTINGKPIIKKLSFSVRRGEIYGFLGPNGSGKTTTIRMMVGLISITEGDIYIAGHNIRTERSQAMTHVGAIVETPELYGYMSGWKNLIHFARMSRNPVSRERMMDIVRLVDLEDAIHRKVKTYSLGMKQRLGIAQALLHRPSILLLDEPTNGLDPSGIRQLRDYLRRLASEENIAIVVSSHLLSEIELMCDRVVIIKDGQFVDERQLHGEAEDMMVYPVVFEVSNADQAALLLEAYGEVKKKDNRVTIEINRETIPQVVTLLGKEGILLYQIRTMSPTLEDMFLSLTKGERQ